MDKKARLYLDKVEKKFLAQIKAMTPEYEDLEIYQVAHLELKEAILRKVRETLKNKSATPRTTPLLFRLVRPFLYKFILLHKRVVVRTKLWIYSVVIH